MNQWLAPLTFKIIIITVYIFILGGYCFSSTINQLKSNLEFVGEYKKLVHLQQNRREENTAIADDGQ